MPVLAFGGVPAGPAGTTCPCWPGVFHGHRVPSAERRAPSAGEGAERRAPSAARRAPSTVRSAPSAGRRAPSAETRVRYFTHGLLLFGEAYYGSICSGFAQTVDIAQITFWYSF